MQGELALVTGGGGGLGRLIALRLSKLGVDIVIWDIKQEGKILCTITTLSPLENGFFSNAKIFPVKIKSLILSVFLFVFG